MFVKFFILILFNITLKSFIRTDDVHNIQFLNWPCVQHQFQFWIIGVSGSGFWNPNLLLELAFDETFVKPCHLELYHKPIQEFFMIKTSQGELIMLCIVMVK